ncbi:hypothetical protein ABEB36_009317 [Hypothenemus hampei]|uniref:GIY-YIG homing endonuclease n=1 Tax=Hypothenemus hampei TaxID=57062 RepID=A0ABD1EFZ9_HYPHA
MRRYIKQRLYEHKNDCKMGKKETNNTTALVEHHLGTGHTFKYEETQILAKQRVLKKRLLHQMINIKKERTSINKRTDIENLNVAYYNLITKSDLLKNKTKNKKKLQ